MISYSEFITEFYSSVLPHKQQTLRDGQQLMIHLHAIWPEGYKIIMESDSPAVDCFYDDKLIQNTLNYLKSIWPKKEHIGNGTGEYL